MTGGTHRVGQPITFRARVGGYTNYSWDFGDATSGTGRSVRHAFSKPGNYYVELSVTDNYGQTNTLDKTVIIPALRGDQLPTIVGPSTKSRKDPQYSQIAGKLAGQARAVFCWNDADWNALQPGTKTIIILGYVEVASPRQVNLSPRICRWLDLIHYKHQRPPPTLDEATAVVTFGHELTHTLLHTRFKNLVPPSQEEAFAQCVGIQLAPYVSVGLGTTVSYGRRLAQIMWSRYTPSFYPPGYWSSKCRPGGPYDLDPENPAWP